MPTTRSQRSRPQTRLHTRKQTGNGHRRAKMHTSKSCTRSGRVFRSTEEDISEGRRSTRSTRSTTRSIKATHAQELRQRIASIPMKGRRVPDTDDLKILGVELKLRLASNCDIISESGRRGGKVNIMPVYSTHRFVPIWDIDKSQDPSLLCEVKVKVKPPRLRNRM